MLERRLVDTEEILRCLCVAAWVGNFKIEVVVWDTIVICLTAIDRSLGFDLEIKVLSCQKVRS